MKSLTAVRKKSPNYPVEFKIKMVELSGRCEQVPDMRSSYSSGAHPRGTS